MNDWVVVYSGNIVETDLLKCLLESEGIYSILQNENIGMIAPYLSPAGAGVNLAIARSDLARARPIVEDYVINKSRRLHEA
ncbi:MAG TPA: DUF2007 domain-containing protein [Terriglobia bacterium]|jgi:hypothetical protein